MKDLIGRTINAMRVGAETLDIYAMLRSEGLNDYQAWLTYKAAQLIVKGDKS